MPTANLDPLLTPIRSILDLGGPVVAILLGVSVVSLAVVLLKLFQFWHGHVGRRGRAEQAVALWSSGHPREAETLAVAGRSAAAQAVAMAMRLTRQNALTKPQIEEEISRFATDRLHTLQGGFRLLDSVAQLSPLLGLFGTVLGMIEAFQKLQEAGNAVDPSLLAGGIWVALLTTAVGLGVAMPVSLVLTWLESRLESERVAIQTLASAVLSPLAYGSAETGMPEAEMESVLAH